MKEETGAGTALTGLTAYTLRAYQDRAVGAGRRALAAGKNGILVLPTGSGKSLVIASLLQDLPGKSLVLQPSKEILEQNLAKARAWGFADLGVWSASCGRKELGQVTFAMIGSIMRHRAAFRDFERVVVDECHLLNSRGGMYESFLTELGVPVVGCTATPYRLRSWADRLTGAPVVQAQILTRTRPRIFGAIAHVTQIGELVPSGFWCPLALRAEADYDADEIAANSTGMDFDEESLRAYHEAKGIVRKVVDAVRSCGARHVLVFTHFRAESAAVLALLAAAGVSAAEVSAETPAGERRTILDGFRAGDIRCVVNVGVLTTGFDFPALDGVVLARPTRSVALYYQMTGRGVRPWPGKERCCLIDLCGNVQRFGRVETFELIDPSGRGLWELHSETGQLTGVNLAPPEARVTSHESRALPPVDPATVVPFGKFKGQTLGELPAWYVRWACEGLKGKWRMTMQAEMQRRRTGV